MRPIKIVEQIYNYMARHHMNQAAVARAAGFTPAKFNDMLRGRIRILAAHINPSCKALRCRPNELFGYGADGLWIGAKEYHQIVVVDSNDKVIAVITDDSVVEHDGYRVLLS